MKLKYLNDFFMFFYQKYLLNFNELLRFTAFSPLFSSFASIKTKAIHAFFFFFCLKRNKCFLFDMRNFTCLFTFWFRTKWVALLSFLNSSNEWNLEKKNKRKQKMFLSFFIGVLQLNLEQLNKDERWSEIEKEKKNCNLSETPFKLTATQITSWYHWMMRRWWKIWNILKQSENMASSQFIYVPVILLLTFIFILSLFILFTFSLPLALSRSVIQFIISIYLFLPFKHLFFSFISAFNLWTLSIWIHADVNSLYD